MSDQLQLSRMQHFWLLSALLCACVPLWFYLPWWVAVVSLVAIAWRVRRLWSGHGAVNKQLMAVLGIGIAMGTLLTFWPPLGLEPMASLLASAAALKYLELDRQKTAILMIYLCYFVAAIQLIFNQNILFFLVSLFSYSVTLAAQTMLCRAAKQQYSIQRWSFEPLKSAGRWILLSIPLTLIIFLVAPRMPSFWSVPLPQSSAQTGVSDQLNPGSVADLSQSSELAFRVSFDGEIPPNRELYWRALVLADFDGQGWELQLRRRSLSQDTINWNRNTGRTHWLDELRYVDQPTQYTVFLEPNSQHWLVSLPYAEVSDRQLGTTRDLRLVSEVPILQRKMYDVTSYTHYQMQPDGLNARQRERNLAYPLGTNPRTEALIQSWLAEGLTPQQLLQRWLAWINQEFTYTTEPGEMQGAMLDRFLFDYQAGFCEHYASATAAILRLAGVPARVVLGYQGGERNPYDDYLLVHQFDAHAWIEYWQEDRGWVQLDPTAAVAPERIELGFQSMFGGGTGLSATFSNFRNMAFGNWLRLQFDSANYLWIRWVMGYDEGSKSGLFFWITQWFNAQNITRALLLFVFSGAAIGGLIWVVTHSRRRTTTSPLVYKLVAKLRKAGVSIAPGETLSQLGVRAEQAFPQAGQDIAQIFSALEELLYQSKPTPLDVDVLARQIKQLKLPAGPS